MKKALLSLIFFCWLLIFEGVQIAILTSNIYFGEREIAWRIKRAAESLGWTVFLDERRGQRLKKIENLDWSISLVPNCSLPNCLNYAALFHPFGYVDTEGQIIPFYEKFDGYLLTIKPELLEGAFRSETKEIFSVPFYPTSQPIEYKKVPLDQLVVISPAWGNRKKTELYQKLYRALSESGFARFYGIQDGMGIVSSGHMGPLPFDGISIIKAIQRDGIVLVLHSEQHLQQGLPSSRIFEAAAASAVIISDENSFVKEHFGDCVYYIDVNLSAEEIFEQIANLMEEIHRYPEAALAKAEQAHHIFEERFQMTDQLLKVQAMHNKIVSAK